MTREQMAREIDLVDCIMAGQFNDYSEMTHRALQEAIKLIKQDPKAEEFARWVATEIFSDMWEFNKDSFAECACRKLAKLGIVEADGDEWKLVDIKGKENS